MKIKPCKKCAASGLLVKYTEVAYQFVNVNGVAVSGEDGHDVQERYLALDDARCVGCKRKRKLSIEEMRLINGR